MKRKLIICIISMLLAAAVFVGCGINMSSSVYCGEWNAVKAVYNKTTLNPDKIFNGGFTIDLRKNGTCTVSLNEKSSDGKWEETEDGAVIDGDREMVLRHQSDGNCVMEYSGIQLCFEKQ